MDDKLRSEVMGDIDSLDYFLSPHYSKMGRFRQVMVDYEHLELQMIQAKRIIGALTTTVEEGGIYSDSGYAAVSHAKAFLEENDGG